jgi:hypothetical protein
MKQVDQFLKKISAELSDRMKKSNAKGRSIVLKVSDSILILVCQKDSSFVVTVLITILVKEAI